LVLRPEEVPDLALEEVEAFLSRRAGLVDGVVITGGEPTLQDDLVPFLHRVRQQGVDIKLDTNGYRPNVLTTLLESKLVDYVAMDVKAPVEKYHVLAGRDDLDIALVEHSIALLRESGLPCEFRTTLVPRLLDEDDVEEIARWIAGADHYVLQQFRPVNTLDPTFEKISPYPAERLEAMAKRARRWVTRTTVRGGGNRIAASR
jgi:pyruvate formate lyase activating enzyme